VGVVGASMGAGIALLASARLQEPGVRFAVLGACLSPNARRLVTEEGKGPCGRVLSIREKSDDFTEPCPAWEDAQSPPSLVVREMVLETGLAHGFLYRPLPQWLDPVVEWLEAP
jgi:pimeloyl-ACP methyl ester carboxylesterase